MGLRFLVPGQISLSCKMHLCSSLKKKTLCGSQANCCNMTFTAGNLFPSLWWDPSQAHTWIWTWVSSMRGGQLTNWAIPPSRSISRACAWRIYTINPTYIKQPPVQWGVFDTRAWLYQRVQMLVLKYGSNEPNIHIKLILSQRYCMNEIRVIGTFLGSGSLDPNIWVLLPFLDPNIGTLLWWKYIREIVIMWLALQTWLTQPGKYNIQLQSPSWNYDPMRLDPKKMVQHQVYTPNIDVTYQGQRVVQVDLHFGVQWLIQYFWCHFQIQPQIFGSNMNLNPLIQSGPELLAVGVIWAK